MFLVPRQLVFCSVTSALTDSFTYLEILELPWPFKNYDLISNFCVSYFRNECCGETDNDLKTKQVRL